VISTPYLDQRGRQRVRSGNTVNAWLVPLRGFYEWADAEGLLSSDVAQHMTQLRYFGPGSQAGGEQGATRRVLVPELRSSSEAPPEPEWVSDPGARQRLLDADLNARDRFLVDLLYFSGVRIGEALSLFRQDMHFGGAPAGGSCVEASAHFHVGENLQTENRASPKRGRRLLYVTEILIDSYVEYVLERDRLLGDLDTSQHLFVNLYSSGEDNGKAMRYGTALKLVRRLGAAIESPMTGPHVLRHTLATRLVRGLECEAVPLDVVQAILGHRSISSTRIYTHDLERAKRNALQSQKPRVFALGEVE